MSNDIYSELRRHNLLQTFFRHRVIADAVAGEDVQPETLAQAHKDFMKQRGLESDEALEAFLNRNGLARDDLNWQLALPYRVRAHCIGHYLHKAEAHFLIRKNQLDRVVYSLLRVQDFALALELYLRIEANEANFADLAAQYGEGMEQQTNGIIGPVPLTKAHPELAERLRTSTAGELLQPFKIANWWLVTRLERYTPAIFDQAMSETMARELFDLWVNEETNRIMAYQSTAGVASAKE